MFNITNMQFTANVVTLSCFTHLFVTSCDKWTFTLDEESARTLNY